MHSISHRNLSDTPEPLCLVVGKRLLIEAVCIEQSSGERKESVSLAAMFASKPYNVDFEKTAKNFKPGLPLVVQVK